MSFPRDIPPLWFAAGIAAMLGLHWTLPGARLWGWPWRLGGVVLIALGLALLLWAAGLFRALGTGIRPGTDATALVARGPYRFTRNPMYLALVAMLVGAAAALGTATPWLVPPALAALLQQRFIRREEAFLRARFGDAYEELCRKVRRWL